MEWQRALSGHACGTVLPCQGLRLVGRVWHQPSREKEIWKAGEGGRGRMQRCPRCLPRGGRRRCRSRAGLRLHTASQAHERVQCSDLQRGSSSRAFLSKHSFSPRRGSALHPPLPDAHTNSILQTPPSQSSGHPCLPTGDGAQPLSLVHLHSTDRETQLGNRREGTGRDAAVQRRSAPADLEAHAAATSAQLPPLFHPDILITEGYELKTPKETLPSSTKSSEDKSKDKPSIILTLWAKIGQTPEEPGS